MPLILALEKQRLVDLCEFKVALIYIPGKLANSSQKESMPNKYMKNVQLQKLSDKRKLKQY